jgi:(R,R)-butanediol dehydrogenase/meso-butanediol dehydrogenase/diacetyl reductase
MMLAAVYRGNRDLRVEQVPVPAPRADELLLSVHATGLCGTDAAEWQHGPRVYASPCGSPHPVTGHRGPLIPGHELAGHVVARGRDVNGFPDGALVACGAGFVVGEDRMARTGRPHLSGRYATVGLQADGGFAQYCAVPARTCITVEDMRPDTVALAQPMAIAVHAIRRGRLCAGERAVVVGAGGIGAFAIAAAVGLVASVVAVDLDPARLEVARRLGAAEAITPQETGDVLGAAAGGAPADVIVEATGSAAAWELVATTAPVGCRIVIAGLQAEPQPVDLRALSQREQELLGTNAHHGDVDLPHALRLLRDRREGWGDVAPVAVPLSDIVDGALMPLVERRAPAIKTLVDPWASAARPTNTTPCGA